MMEAFQHRIHQEDSVQNTQTIRTRHLGSKKVRDFSFSFSFLFFFSFFRFKAPSSGQPSSFDPMSREPQPLPHKQGCCDKLGPKFFSILTYLFGIIGRTDNVLLFSLFETALFLVQLSCSSFCGLFVFLKKFPSLSLLTVIFF